MENKSEMHLLETENIGDIVGLLEILEDLGESVDIATLDDSLDEERTTLLNLLNDAEALGLVNVFDGDVSLTKEGSAFLKADLTERKVILRKLLSRIEPFASIMGLLQKADEGTMEREELDEFLGGKFPSEDPEVTFRVLVNWGRYSKLFDYDMDDETLTFIT